MENKERQILSEIQEMMASLRSQIEALEVKLAELQLNVGAEDVDMTPIDLDIDDFQEVVEESPEEQVEDVPVEDVPVEEVTVDDVPVEEVTVDDDLPFDEPSVEEPVEEPAEEYVEETVEEPVEDLSVPETDVEDDLPFFDEPEPVIEKPSVTVAPKTAVIDSMTEKQAWRTDMPGTQVKDIRSAISLNDRILFINMLFDQDPMVFQEALTRINQMASIEEVISYVNEERPQWDLDSETVYRFMMAVRRKIR